MPGAVPRALDKAPSLALSRGVAAALALALAVLFAPAHVLAQDEESDGNATAETASGRDALERFARDLHTYHAAFEQKIIDSDGVVQDANEGQMWLSRPSRFRWEYGGDFPEVIVADGEHVWMHDISLEQVTVKNQADLANDSPLIILTDLGKLDEQFEVRDMGTNEGLAYVELRSVREAAEFDRVLLGIRGESLELMAMEDAFGLRTEIRIANARRNPDLAGDLFEFEPPEGVDVVGDVVVRGLANTEELE